MVAEITPALPPAVTLVLPPERLTALAEAAETFSVATAFVGLPAEAV